MCYLSGFFVLFGEVFIRTNNYPREISVCSSFVDLMETSTILSCCLDPSILLRTKFSVLLPNITDEMVGILVRFFWIVP